MHATANELSLSARRRTRLLIETYYDCQELRIMTNHRIQNYAEAEALVGLMGEEAVEALIGLKDKNVAFKKAIREFKAKDHERHEEFKTIYDLAVAKLEGDDRHKKANDLMQAQEDLLKKQIMAEIKDHPLWTEWLSKVTGIGPCLAGGLLAWINIKKCQHAGNLIKYAGLAVVIDSYECPNCKNKYSTEEIRSITERTADGMPEEAARCLQCNCFLKVLGHADRRAKGQVVGYNPKVKTLMYKVGQSFVKCSAETSGYRRIYDDMRAKIDAKTCNKVHKNDKGEVVACFDAHRFAMATRATVKIFASHVYTVWRGLLGLPVSKPFAFGMLGHDMSSMIEPIYDDK